MYQIFVFIVMLLHMSVGMLDFVTDAQQQGNIIQTTTTLSEARYNIAATSSKELVFFAGGFNSTKEPSDRVDIYNVTSGSWRLLYISATPDY
jgi:hypothetical protein